MLVPLSYCRKYTITLLIASISFLYYTGFLAFSRNMYVFSEEQGIGSIQIDGTAGLMARVVGGIVVYTMSCRIGRL